jgi:hypothetical protein
MTFIIAHFSNRAVTTTNFCYPSGPSGESRMNPMNYSINFIYDSLSSGEEEDKQRERSNEKSDNAEERQK